MTTIPQFEPDGRRLPALGRTGVQPRLKRTADYRLRGLDLDAPLLAESAAPKNQRRHAGFRHRRRRRIVQAIVALTVAALVAAGMRGAVVEPYRVTSTSMVPTLQPDTEVLVLTSSLLRGDLHRGDVVVLRPPAGATCAGDGATGSLVTRVIGLPGDTLWTAEDRLYVNGTALDEAGWHNPPYGEAGGNDIRLTTVEPGRYFVLGDNRTDTCDSRAFGAVPESDVVGEVLGTIARNGHPSIHRI